MTKKTLLAELKEKEVDIGKVLETPWLNIMIPQGSSSFDGGYVSYPKDKVEALLNKVPLESSYQWSRILEANGQLRETEEALISANETGSQHPMYMIDRFTASKMISAFKHCSENYRHWQ